MAANSKGKYSKYRSNYGSSLVYQIGPLPREEMKEKKFLFQLGGFVWKSEISVCSPSAKDNEMSDPFE